MGVRIETGSWQLLGLQARRIRNEVFIEEQRVPVELEWDDMDEKSLHALACDAGGDAVGTARLLPDGHIGRMAVRKNWRGQGIGRELLLAMMRAAQQRGDAQVLLNAQIQAVPFYAKFGFVPEGAEFMDAGIPHVCMRHVFV